VAGGESEGCHKFWSYCIEGEHIVHLPYSDREAIRGLIGNSCSFKKSPRRGSCMAKKIWWFSRHKPMDFQIPILREKFGEDMVLVQSSESEAYMTGDKIVECMHRERFDEIIMVAPLSVIEKVIERGLRPIKAEVVEVKDAHSATFIFNRRHYKFIKFVRIVRIEIITEDLDAK